MQTNTTSDSMNPRGYIGLIFAYRHPEGGTHFEAHPDAEFGEEKWIRMLKVPVLGTGLTYQEKIMCRLTGLTYEEYLTLQDKDKEGAPNISELSPCEAPWRVPSLNQTAGLHSAQEVVAAATMKGEMFDDLPKHQCPKPGSPWLGFASFDFDVMNALVDRGASSEEVNDQVKAWIAAAAATNPNPTEPVSERFQAALFLARNTPKRVPITCSKLLKTQVPDPSSGIMRPSL
ncbi:MAG TPA: hypothetical protein VE957_15920 [Terriglobales bacterium]|nr:hypothetical protein [Terriglobales bacterium]